MMRGLLLAALLAAPADINTRLKEFAAAMKAAKSDDDRIDAINTLARTRHVKAASKIVQVIRVPYSARVRVAAADAVGRIGYPRSGRELQAVLNTFGTLLASENPNRPDGQKVLEAVVQAMGACRDRSCVPRLVQLLSKNNIPLMREAVKALTKIRDASCLEPLIRLHYAANSPEGGGATNPRKPLAPHTLQALHTLTRDTSISSADDWKKWWRTYGRAFRLPPEASLGGLPSEFGCFAVYTGTGETDALRQFDFVLIKGENYTKKRDLENVRAIALSGDPKKVLRNGFIGFVVEAKDAAAMRKKYPGAFLVCRTADAQALSHVNAILVENLDPRKPDKAAVDALKDAMVRSKVAVLALFTAAGDADAAEAIKFARTEGFIPYAAPDAERSKIATHTLP